MRFGQALNGFVFVTVTATIGGASMMACSSSSSSSSGSGSSMDVSGDYLATSPGILREVTFVDSSHYSWQRTVCPNADTGCTETGTYVKDDQAGTITFTTADGFYSLTLPMAAGASANESTDTQSLHIDDLNSAADSGLAAGTGGNLTNNGGSLLKTISIGEQSFSSTTLAPAGDDDSDGGSSGDGGVSLVTSSTGTWMPTVVNQQGALIVGGAAVITPTVVSVTWNADANAGLYERFTEALPGSPYWAATTAEYGVGPLILGPHVRLTTTPPTTLKTETMVTWINAQISAKNSTWPKPVTGTFYEIYVPPTASARYTEENKLGCESFSGEHSSGTYKGQDYAYAVMLECNGAPAKTVTSTAAHELVEGAADPYQTKPAYLGFDPAHLAWDLLQNFQDEIADACEDFPNIDAMVQGSAGSYNAQRTWSNAAALAGHDPCVPAPAGVAYFNVSPQGMSTVSVKTPSTYYPPSGAQNSPKHLQGLGYKIAVGSSFKIPIVLNSDVAGTGPWTLAATEGAPDIFQSVTSKSLTLSLDKSSGSAGDTVNLTVKVKSANASLGGELITIASTMNGVTHYAPILIGN